MRIERRGYERDHGSSKIQVDPRSVALSVSKKMIELTDYGVVDFKGASRHSYVISIHIDELKRILNVAAKALQRPDGKETAKVFGPSLTSILNFALQYSAQLAEEGGGEEDEDEQDQY